MRVIHLGYYNDIKDIIMLETDSIENIISYMKMGFGNFHTLENDWEDIELKEKDFDITPNGEYLIVRDINDNANSFIDIYKIQEDEIAKSNIWWTNIDFELMGKITGYDYRTFIVEFAYDEFITTWDKYWRNLSYGERLKFYALYY